MSIEYLRGLYDALRDYLLQAEERAVFRALPRHIATQLTIEPHVTLRELVEATFQGDAVLNWEIACPACGYLDEHTDWLRHAHHNHSCPACGKNFDIHLDGEAQVTFSPHPTLRSLGPTAKDPEFQRTVRERFSPTTVQELMTVQAFRDWAQNESLPPGEYLQVRRMVVWFSDLAGSTALYACSGDPFAFGLVREHFDHVFEAINQCRGAVVKTMGDGVMGIFNTASDGLRAALNAHQAMDDFNRRRALADDRQLLLKVGIHAGPAIVVMLNERLDYFGTTVNVASRVSDLAQGTETVFTESIYADVDVQAHDAARVSQPFQSDIRGLGQSLQIYRLKWR